MNISRKFELSEISIHRTELMGACTIGILACHMLLVVNGGGILRKILLLGNCGVQGFMFLSGMGIHRSLQKRNGPLIAWYERRISRVLIPYLIVAIPYWILWSVIHAAGVVECIKGILFIKFWTEHDGFWFVAAIIPMYLLAPLFEIIYKKSPWKLGITIIVTLLFLIISFHAHEEEASNSVIWNIQWCMEKTAPFFLGYYYLDFMEAKRFINASVFTVCTIGLFLLLSIEPTIGIIDWWWLLVFPAFIFICIAINNFGDGFRRPLHFFGNVSLESYMLNVALIKLFIEIRNRTPFFEGDKVAIIAYFLIVIVGCILSIPYGKMTKRALLAVSSVYGFNKTRMESNDSHV